MFVVNRLCPRLLHSLFLLTLLFCAAWLALHALRQTEGHRQRLYAQLLTGSHDRQLMAAAALVHLGAERQLLAALKTEQPEPREVARRALEFFWFNAAGKKAYTLLQAAHQAMEQEHQEKALGILNRLTTEFPGYAEGWNRRAALHYQRREFARSIADCERALALNPNHYGAWQGLGICWLQQGDVAEACRCLRAALRIIPHDSPTRETLQQCEDLLRQRDGEGSSPPGRMLI